MESNELRIRKNAVSDAILKALGHLQLLPTNRETALVKTKLEEAAMWLEKVN